MDFLYNNSLINQIVDKLFKHRRVHYSEFHLDDLAQDLGLNYEIVQVINGYYEKLHATIFKKQENVQICIVFMHGYGSNRLECINILEILPAKYALCSFDFSGCGKSQGDLITYGMKEKQDIHFILNFLKGKGFKKFILWGRSMGGTATLLYTIKYKPTNIILLILDSPFYSFQSIAFDIANKNTKAPQFVIAFALQMAKKNCFKFQHNPFQIQLKDVHKVAIPSIFMYCQEDNVISSQNTYKICSKYKAKYEKLIIAQNHNTIRSQNTIKQVILFIDKYQIKDKVSVEQLGKNLKKHQNNDQIYDFSDREQTRLTKNQSSGNKIQYFPRKGIQRVNQMLKKQNSSIIDKDGEKSIIINDKFSSQISRRPHLSLKNIGSSLQKAKNYMFKAQRNNMKNKIQICQDFIDEISFSPTKNTHKKITLIQSTKLNHRNKSKILE